MISTSGRSSRHLLGLGLFLALCLLTSCSAEPGPATQTASTTVAPETPAASVAHPTHPSQVSTPPPTWQSTATHTPTPESSRTPESTATEIPSTPAPIPELGAVEDGAFWNGNEWLALPEGDGWQVSVDAQTGEVKAKDVNGSEYTWENDSWVEVVPTPEPTPRPEYPFQVPASDEAILQALENVDSYGWPSPVQQNGEYEIHGVLARPEIVHKPLGDSGYEVILEAEFYYKDPEGNAQMVMVPLMLGNEKTGFYFEPTKQWGNRINLNKADIPFRLANEYGFTSPGHVVRHAFVTFQWYDLSTSDPREYTDQSGQIYLLEYDDYIGDIQDKLGISDEKIVDFRNTGDAQLLYSLDGIFYLFPSKLGGDGVDPLK